MNCFVHEQNLRHLRQVLARTTDARECRRIVELIEREEGANRLNDNGLGRNNDETPPRL